MTKSKDTKRQRAELLGMPYGTAEKRLRKAIIYELAQQTGKCVCRWCSSSIESPDDFSVVHVQDWQDDPDSFWDLTNIAFSHASCAAKRGDKRQEKQDMSKIDVIIEDENGKLLPGTNHKGKIYVAGKKRQRYNIRIRNKSAGQLLIVCTVDGLNVVTGEAGDWNDGGHVIGPFEEWKFEGWRQDNDTVAAFRFGKNKDSYSSQQGTPENVGVIGVAVFEEHQPPPRVITIKEKEYIPYPVPTPWEPDPWRGIRPYPFRPITIHPHSWTTLVDNTAPTTGSSFSITSSIGGGGGGGTYTSGGDIFLTASTGNDFASVLSHGNTAQGSDIQINAAQVLGTGFGEDLESSVRDVHFQRATEEPIEVYEIRYDTMANFQKQGIQFHRPSQQKKASTGAEAFPKNKGFCSPPRKRVLYR